MEALATVTSHGMTTIPSEIRKKYKINDGDKVKFIETDGGIVMVPVKNLKDCFGIDGQKMLEIAKEIEIDRKKESEHDDKE